MSDGGRTWDVVIAGAGPAGAACGHAAAAAGLRTLLLEMIPEDQPTRACIVDVECSAFPDSGLEPPDDELLAFPAHRTRIFSPQGRHAFDMPPASTHTIHLDRLVARLQARARSAGAVVQRGHQVIAPRLEDDRCTGVIVRRSDGSLRELSARLVVDATGNAAAVIRRLPESTGVDFSDRLSERVRAETRLYRLGREQALALANRQGMEPNVAYMQLGMNGPCSTQVRLIWPEEGLALLLVGLKEQHAPEAELQRRIEGWERSFGCPFRILRQDGATIRVRRASLRLVSDGFAAVGEAAGMVIPIHGSGVATGLRTGRDLGRHAAQLLRGRRDLTVEQTLLTTAELWPWAARYQRTRGTLMATFDVQRRMIDRLAPSSEVETLLRSGFMLPEDVSRAVAARPPRIRTDTLPTRLRAMVQHPLLTLRLLSGVQRLLAVEAHWSSYPPTWDPRTFVPWRKVATQLLP